VAAVPRDAPAVHCVCLGSLQETFELAAATATPQARQFTRRVRQFTRCTRQFTLYMRQFTL
jgi:hypothetical protein